MNSSGILVPNWNEVETIEFDERRLEYMASNGYEQSKPSVPQSIEEWAESSKVNLNPAIKIEAVEVQKPPEQKPTAKLAIPEAFNIAFKQTAETVLDPTKDVLKEAPGAIGELIFKDMIGLESKPKTPLKSGQTEVNFKEENKKVAEAQFAFQRRNDLERDIREVIAQNEQKEDARLGLAGMSLTERVIRAGVQAGLQTVESVRNRYTRIFTITKEGWTAIKQAKAQQSAEQIWAGKNGPNGNMYKLNAQEGNSMVANAVMTAG